MRSKRLLIALAAAGVMLMSALPGQAAGTVTVTDTTSDGKTIEPIQVKADAQVGMTQFRTAALNHINIKNVSLTTNSATDTATFTIEVENGIPTTAADVLNLAPPYGGADLLVHFQVDTQEQATNLGCLTAQAPSTPCAQQSKWTPIYKADRQYYFIHYQIAGNAQSVPGIPDYEVSFGAYDPSGVLEPPIGPGVGQLWTTFGRDHSVCQPAAVTLANNGAVWPYTTGVAAQPLAGNNVNVSFSSQVGSTTRYKKVHLTMPYNYRWLTNSTCLMRSKQLINDNQAVTNVNGFSWALHLLGAGVGPAVGWTWYTDSAPGVLGAPGVTATGYGYKVGTPAGDPNPSAFRLHNCPSYTGEVQTNPLANGLPCMIANPVGPGFRSSGAGTTG